MNPSSLPSLTQKTKLRGFNVGYIIDNIEILGRDLLDGTSVFGSYYEVLGSESPTQRLEGTKLDILGKI